MTATTIAAANVTVTKIGETKEGVKIFQFKATDSTVAADGAVITLPQVKRIVGYPVIMATGTAASAVSITTVSVTNNVITTASLNGSAASTYYGIVYGK